MAVLVPFDGSDLARTALNRATAYADLVDDEVVALSVVPPDTEYAREQGWLDGDEPFAVEQVCGHLEAQVREHAPEATFRCETAEDVDSRASVAMDVSRTIRQVAHELGVDIVFIGSENAGRVSRPVTSVGSPVSEDPQYDVHIVRHPD